MKNMHTYRTHHCAQLNKTHVGQTAKLSGWVHRKRDHGNLLFIDLRDHYGITQLVATEGSAHFAALTEVKLESVITVGGRVVARAPETVNKDLPTGEIELVAESYALESAADPLPVQVNSDREQPEETRLKYRFLDLRREKIHANIMLRSKVIASLRRRMIEQGFNEFQTPILTASSPEGARDYLVPSRIHPGKFYALPQAPQQFKQLLMVSGFDRYFQIAPCFRDEDGRADRSPGEFYQLDIEMSFVTQEDVFAAIEPVLEGVFREFGDKQVTPAPFPRITYKEAMLKYGSDKPDLRNPILVADVAEVWKGSGFGIFNKVIEAGGTVRAIPAPGCADKPRSFFDNMIEFAKSLGAQGLAYITYKGGAEITPEAFGGPLVKFLSNEALAKLVATAGLKAGDAVFFSSGAELAAAKLAGHVRNHLGAELGLIEQGVFKFLWVVDFPYFEYDEEEKKIIFSHNPFSMPQGGREALETQDPLTIKAYQYDAVCNGYEIASGSIRNQEPETMIAAFEKTGKSKAEVEEQFGGLYRAFQYGAPPHGGAAFGVDRIVMLLCGVQNLREITLFPMNQQAEDLLMGAPSQAEPKQLRELGIRLNLS